MNKTKRTKTDTIEERQDNQGIFNTSEVYQKLLYDRIKNIKVEEEIVETQEKAKEH